MEINQNREYWVIEYLEDDETKWKEVLNYVLPIATHIEFNILYSCNELDSFINTFNDSVVEITNKKNKLYKSGKIIRFHLTPQLKVYLKNKSFSYFQNFYIEDPSFYINDREIIATISHEEQIYLNPNYVDLSYFINFKLKYKIFEKDRKSLWNKIIKYIGKYFKKE